jgi:hypothetical protein
VVLSVIGCRPPSCRKHTLPEPIAPRRARFWISIRLWRKLISNFDAESYGHF